VVVEVVLFGEADGGCFFEGFVLVAGGDKAKLFVELRGVVSIAADDPENDLG
jgi:hypothetical protein